jgi:hypothetical protein
MKGYFVEEFDFIMRKAIVGDWKNYFNRNERDLVDEKVIKLFSGTGLENLLTEDQRLKVVNEIQKIN